MKYVKLLVLVITQQCKQITACTLPKHKICVLHSNTELVDLVRGNMPGRSLDLYL